MQNALAVRPVGVQARNALFLQLVLTAIVTTTQADLLTSFASIACASGIFGGMGYLLTMVLNDLQPQRGPMSGWAAVFAILTSFLSMSAGIYGGAGALLGVTVLAAVLWLVIFLAEALVVRARR